MNQNDKSNLQSNAHLHDSFAHAFEGIISAIRTERNMKIHVCMAVLVTIFGFILDISKNEWIICIILFAFVMSMEVVNTSIEAVVDLICPEYNPLAKKAKDSAAGAVLICAIGSAIIGCIIFLPKLYVFILNYFG